MHESISFLQQEVTKVHHAALYRPYIIQSQFKSRLFGLHVFFVFSRK